MVLINGVKYACERCIRGHRVTTCNHTDQPLMMIKPKGRPSTTCAHCKELRKNKNANPTGVCSCGRQEKKRLAQKAKEEARAKGKSLKDEDCKCGLGEKCVCHTSRRARRTPSSKSKTALSSVHSVDSSSVLGFDSSDHLGKVFKNQQNLPSLTSFHSSQSLDQDFALATSPTISTAYSNGNNWDTNSISSSLRSESRLNMLDRSQNSIGLDPLAHMKPVTASTRVRVGEVNVPLEEYVPPDINGIGNVSDTSELPKNTQWSSFESGNGLLDLFADTSRASTNYSQMKSNHHQQRKSLDFHTRDGGPSPPDNFTPNMMKSRSCSQQERPFIFKSKSTLTNNSLDRARPSIAPLRSEESLLSSQYGGPLHEPLHHSYSNRQFAPQLDTVQDETRSSFDGGHDNESVQSVEVLSITPSFMDIPDNSKLYAPSSNPFLPQPPVSNPRKRSVSIHRNHRYESDNIPSMQRVPSDRILDRSNSSIASRRDRQDYSQQRIPLSNSVKNNDLASHPGSINPTILSNFDTVAGSSSSKPSPRGDSSYAIKLSNDTSPVDDLSDRLLEPTSSITSELEQILASNTNDNQPAFFAPMNTFEATDIPSDDSPLRASKYMTTPSPGQSMNDLNFAELDNLMTDL
ncbi:LAMI_0B03598g1_1 [Lachancea mirantina]|uniref:LAMI_0B03598g1_1 n=1 Tax=Lachancea mirantina TaxID=1230905 RepID=A0A1G4IVD0_9SACH|nr:LAMI_0B03598g1_1 [Lachancea mirantina]